MLALNPGTPICVLENTLELIDAVLVITVTPGFFGQKLILGALDKIWGMRAYLDAHGRSEIKIEVDGMVGISPLPAKPHSQSIAFS